MPLSHDMTTGGQGSNSRANTARWQQGSPTNADRLSAERRPAPSAVSHSEALAEHYAERAAQKEAEQRELEAWRAEQKAEAVRSKRADMHGRWMADEPSKMSLEEARESFTEYQRRAEGEELAVSIFNHHHAPWLND